MPSLVWSSELLIEKNTSPLIDPAKQLMERLIPDLANDAVRVRFDHSNDDDARLAVSVELQADRILYGVDPFAVHIILQVPDQTTCNRMWCDSRWCRDAVVRGGFNSWC